MKSATHRATSSSSDARSSSSRWLPSTFGQRVIGFVAAGLAATTVALGFDLWQRTAYEVEASETSRIEGVAAALSHTVDGDLLESWDVAYPNRDDLTSWSEAPEDLQSAREILVATQEAARIDSPIYTLHLREEFRDQVRANPEVGVEDAMEFVLSSASEPYWRHTYGYRPEMAPALFDGKSSSSSSYEDEHGQWLSGYAPIQNSAGETVGLLEVDKPVDSALITARYRTTGHLGGLLLCFFGSLVLVVMLHTDMRRREIETEKLAMVATRTDNAVIITGPTGIVEWANEGFASMYGQNASTAEGQNLGTLLCHLECEKTWKEVRGAFASGSPIARQLPCLRKTGERFWSSSDLQPIRNSNGILTHWVIVQQDITQQKEAERLMIEARDQAIENSRLQTEILGNVGHELRTPLNAVLGFSDILEETELDEEQLEFVQTIREAGQSLCDQITEMMEFSLLQAGTLSAVVERIEPEAILARLEARYLPAARQRSLRLETELTRNTPLHFHGDLERIEQTLGLFLSNAIKFTENGTVRLRVHSDGENIRFDVADTGIGIPLDQQTQVFESFRQADGSTTRKVGGKGLGLAMAHRLGELMEGQVGMESTVGTGSTFWLSVPLAGVARGSNSAESGTVGTASDISSLAA